MSQYSAEKVKQAGYDVVGRTDASRTRIGKEFDAITGEAAVCGTLTVAMLLQFIRPYVVQQAVPDLDAYAHVILDL